MNRGYILPDGTYVQVVGDVGGWQPPGGAVEVPLKPGPNMEWDGEQWQAGNPPALTVEDYKTAVQSHMDAAARSKLYTDGNSLATYTASTNPQWAAEAQAFVAWRDAVWAQVYAMWASPPDPVPSPGEVVAGLPVIEWPEVGE